MRRAHRTFVLPFFLLATTQQFACGPPPAPAVPDWRGGQERREAIVDLIRPPRGSGPVPLPQFDAPGWLYFSRLPESVAFPPDNHNYYSPPVAGALPYRAPGGQQVSIIDAYGWLWPESGKCTGDPDWHFGFEIDPARTAIDLNVLYKVGNAIHMGRSASGATTASQSYRVLSTTPRVHVEVTGWRVADHGNIDPSAWGWVHSTPDCEDGKVLWAFDPAQPEGKPVPQGAYVHITGLLVTDGFHVTDNAGYRQLPSAGDLSDVKKMWANCHFYSDCKNTEFEAGNLARWYEIHSPDAIHIEDEQKPQTEVVRQIVLSADHGFWSGMTERIEDDIWPCPEDPSHPCAMAAGKSIGYIEAIDGVTNYRTITDGKCDANGCVPKVDLYSDHIHVMAQVHGEGGSGAPGKLKVTYRVFPCECGCDGTCQVPGSSARVQCLALAPTRCSQGSICRASACVPCHCNPCGSSPEGCECINTCPPDRHECAPDGSCSCVPHCAMKCGGVPDGCGGACTGNCPAGKSCNQGTCTGPIGGGAGCDPPCPRGQVCREGSCGRSCPAGMRDCGDGTCAPPRAECP